MRSAQYWPGTTVVRHRAPRSKRSDVTWGRRVGAAAAAVMVLLGLGGVLPTRAQAAVMPERLAAYYQWYGANGTENWGTGNAYSSAYGLFSSDNQAIMAADLAAFRQSGLTGVYASWWGIGQKSEQTRLPHLLAVAAAAGMRVTAYHEQEGQLDRPTLTQLRADLAYLHAYADAYPSWLRRDGRPVLMVYNASPESSTCAETQRWADATVGTDWLIILKVFSGYKSCLPQPFGWHQYAPAVRYTEHSGVAGVSEGAAGVSAGFDKYNEPPRLVRDDQAWCEALTRQVLSGMPWQLSYGNEFREGTQIVPVTTRMSASGWGTDLDIMRQVYVEGRRCLPATPTPSPTVTASPSPTVSPSPTTSPTASPTPTSTTPSPTSSPTSSPSPTATPTTPPGGDTVTVVAAGDVVCQSCNGYGSSSGADGYTAELTTKYHPDAVLGLGDLQYEEGSLAQYQAGWGRTSCSSPGNCDAWGQHMSITYPAPGNHEWLTANAQGYRTYFGTRLAAIGSDTPSPNPQLYYSYDLGAWHFVSLDSDCGQVGGCSAGKPMTNWLVADLAANNGRPTIVYYHHATWSSGSHGSRTDHEYLKQVFAADLDVQIVLSGHDHIYERFGPMGVSGPQAGGVRHWTVGTGGKNHTLCGAPIPGSQVCNDNTFGLLKLVLSPTGYAWEFLGIDEVGAPGNTFADSGSSGLRLPPALAGVVAQTSSTLTGLGNTMANRLHLLLAVRPDKKVGKP